MEKQAGQVNEGGSNEPSREGLKAPWRHLEMAFLGSLHIQGKSH